MAPSPFKQVLGALVVFTTFFSPGLTAFTDSCGSFGGNSMRQEVGLADATVIDAVEVFWPVTGRTQVFQGVERDRAYTIVEGDDTLHPLTLKPFKFPAPTPPAPHH